MQSNYHCAFVRWNAMYIWKEQHCISHQWGHVNLEHNRMCSNSCKPEMGSRHEHTIEKGQKKDRTVTNPLILVQFFFPPVFFGKLLNYNPLIVSSMHLSSPKPNDFQKYKKPPCSVNSTTKGKSTHIFKHFKWKLMWFFHCIPQKPRFHVLC